MQLQQNIESVEVISVFSELVPARKIFLGSNFDSS